MESSSTSSTISETSTEIYSQVDELLMAIELVDLSVDELESEVADCIKEVRCLSFKTLVVVRKFDRLR